MAALEQLIPPWLRPRTRSASRSPIADQQLPPGLVRSTGRPVRSVYTSKSGVGCSGRTERRFRCIPRTAHCGDDHRRRCIRSRPAVRARDRLRGARGRVAHRCRARLRGRHPHGRSSRPVPMTRTPSPTPSWRPGGLPRGTSRPRLAQARLDTPGPRSSASRTTTCGPPSTGSARPAHCAGRAAGRPDGQLAVGRALAEVAGEDSALDVAALAAAPAVVEACRVPSPHGNGVGRPDVLRRRPDRGANGHPARLPMASWRRSRCPTRAHGRRETVVRPGDVTSLAHPGDQATARARGRRPSRRLRPDHPGTRPPRGGCPLRRGAAGRRAGAPRRRTRAAVPRSLAAEAAHDAGDARGRGDALGPRAAVRVRYARHAHDAARR